MNATKNLQLPEVPPAASLAAVSSVLDRIGNTPLLRLERVSREFPDVEFYAKAEWLNPGGSVKDRAAFNMIREGELSGELRPGKTLLDSTSGNTGIAYAMIAAVKGYKVKLCLPASATIERKRILAAYGAQLVLTPADEGSDGAIRRVRQIYAEDPERYFYPDQYSNPANWRAHYQTTAPEIWRSEEHTSELQSLAYLVCRLLLEKKKKENTCVGEITIDSARECQQVRNGHPFGRAVCDHQHQQIRHSDTQVIVIARYVCGGYVYD